MSHSEERYSSYLGYLPEIYSSGVDAEYLKHFLDIFKRVLSENPGSHIIDSLPLPNEGVEEILDKIHEFFNPYTAPGSTLRVLGAAPVHNHAQRNFLKWLAQWVSFSYEVYVTEETLRTFIPQLIPLYAKRGTREGMEEYIELFTGKGTAEIFETPLEKKNFALYLSSRANQQMVLNNPYVFGIRIDLTKTEIVKNYTFSGTDLPTQQQIEYVVSLFKQIVCNEKPAHTDVVLILHVAEGLRIAVTSTIAKDTKLGFGVEIIESTASFNLA